jgi:hypothetical protein
MMALATAAIHAIGQVRWRAGLMGPPRLGNAEIFILPTPVDGAHQPRILAEVAC